MLFEYPNTALPLSYNEFIYLLKLFVSLMIFYAIFSALYSEDSVR